MYIEGWKKMVEGKTLIVEKYDYGFRFYFKGEEDKSWFVKDHPTLDSFLIIEEEDRQATNIYTELYENMGIEDICGLYLMLLADPTETIYMLINEKYDIIKIDIIDNSEEEKDGFESCSFWFIQKA